MTNAELMGLLARTEGDGLDFKGAQYELDIAGKAELIKDVVAMANSWYPGDRYILIGVVEGDAPPASVIDIEMHHDDATLQQIINGGKLNRRVQFSYSVVIYDDKRLGVLHIPEQERPFFLEKRFGSLAENAVPVRCGSSTTFADPDEVYRMGLAAGLEAAKPLPAPTLSMLHPIKCEAGERCLADFPYCEVDERFGGYFGSLVEWAAQKFCFRPLAFSVANPGRGALENARLEFKIVRDSGVQCTTEWDFEKSKPIQTGYLAVRALASNAHFPSIWCHLNTTDNEYCGGFKIGTVQPGDTNESDDSIWIAANQHCAADIAVECVLFADNLQVPLRCTFYLEPSLRSVPLTAELAQELFDHEND